MTFIRMSTPSSKARWFNLSRIPKEKRAEAWARLQENCPAQAALVQDEYVQAIHKAFGADIIIEIPAGSQYEID
jgi:hypothetical protein